MSTTPDTRVGDVFSVTIDDQRVGVGQVVGQWDENARYFAVFEPVFDLSAIDIDVALASPVVLLALSFDSLIYLGKWPRLGHRPVPHGVPFPAFKVMVGGPSRIDVIDFSGTRRRQATAREAEELPNRRIVAPIRLEDALKARFGLIESTPSYRLLAPVLEHTTARLFDD